MENEDRVSSEEIMDETERSFGKNFKTSIF